MSALQNEEQRPLTNIIDSGPEEEEEKNAIFSLPSSYQNDSYHAMENVDSLSDHSSNAPPECVDMHRSDFSSSSFLLCRITIFLYAFMSILIFQYFPSSQIVNAQSPKTISAQWNGWFKFYIFVNIIACILGIIGVYINRAKLIFLCWTFLSVSLFLTAFLIISYIFNKDKGVHFEATNRCKEYEDNGYSLDGCVENMQYQLIWIVIGLFVIYSIAASFGIYIIRNHERFVKHYLMKHPNMERKESNLSDLSCENDDIELEQEDEEENEESDYESKKEK